MGLSWQEHWSGLPFPSPGDLPDSGTELASPALAGDSLLLRHLGASKCTLKLSQTNKGPPENEKPNTTLTGDMWWHPKALSYLGTSLANIVTQMSASYETAHSFIGPFSAKNDVIIFYFIIKTEYTYQGKKGHLNNKSKKENQKWAVGRRGKIILGG